MNELGKYVHEGDWLLCYQNCPTIHYLTHTRPYLYNPWPWSYDSGNLERQFRRAEAAHRSLPVIVRDKSVMPRWYDYDPDWNNDHAQDTFIHKNRKVELINLFLRRNPYRLVWENEVFQILIPETGTPHPTHS